MRRELLAAALLCTALSACESADVRAAHQAEQRLAMIRQAGASKDEICAASREVADAWLHALDQRKYQMAKLEAGSACLTAELSHLNS